MDELNLPETATWAAVVLAALAIAYAVLRRKWAHEDEETKTKRLHYNEYLDTLHEWQDAKDRLDGASMASAALRLEWMRKQKWNVAPLVIAVLSCLVSGCHTPPQEPVVLNDHVRIVAPGDIVPQLPSGEPGWWLATPTGMGMLLPVDMNVDLTYRQNMR